MRFLTVTAFWAVSIAFVLVPGMDWAYAISAGISSRVAPAVSGLLTGHVAATIVVAAGVGALVAASPLALIFLAVVGAAYLLWLGFGLAVHPPLETKAETHPNPASGSRWFLKGVGVSGLNPKVILLFLALLPPFADPQSPWPVPCQLLLLGSVHVLNCAGVYFFVGFGSQRVLRTKPRAAAVVARVSGVCMIVIAVAILWERLVPTKFT